MKQQPRIKTPSPALVIACVALAVALSGVGYAAVTLPRASVGTKQLKKNSVNSAKIKNGSLVPADFKGGVVNAGLFDGLDSTAFLPATGEATDADKLDGMDSLAFMRGNGIVYSAARAYAQGSFAPIFLSIGNFIGLAYDCPFPGDASWLYFFNYTASVMNVFADSGGANPTYYQLVPFDGGDEGMLFLPANAAGESYFLQVQGAGGIATIQVATVNRVSDCHAQALVVRSL
jgi:hypothetical protein